MEPSQTAAGQAPGPGFYLWEVPGKPVSVYLHYDVVDRLLLEVMRGFGSVPRRGAEVGGLLLGTATRGQKLVIRIEDYEPVPCDHLRGPSYVLMDKDGAVFTEKVNRWRQSPERRLHAVGFYRSHTREGLGLSLEDEELFARHFDDSSVVLLIKPFATRVSTAGFFFRENGTFHGDSTYQEFPFRRRELGGGPAGQPAGRFVEAEPIERMDTGNSRQESLGFKPQQDRSNNMDIPIPSSLTVPPPDTKIRSGWVWIPLSFIFLLLGVLLGFQAAISLRPRTTASGGPDPYALSLSVSRSGDSLHLKWDQNAPAIRNATRGVLTISDGAYGRTIELDANQLRVGSVLYRRVSDAVTFRLDVYPKDRVIVGESLDYKTGTPGK